MISGKIVQHVECFYKRYIVVEKYPMLRLLCKKKLMSDMSSAYEIDWYALIRDSGMNWNQIRELVHHPHCTIGGHTISQPALNKLSIENAIKEIKDGIIRIMEQTQSNVSYFGSVRKVC